VPTISNIHHISFTVTDIDRSVAWYMDVLGLDKLMEEQHPNDPGYAVVLGSPDWAFCVGLHVHPTNASEQFVEARTGLDHAAFTVAGRAELEAWAERLTGLGIEHSGIKDCGSYSLIVFRDPDNIQLELFTFV
jgi:catechol 2,3-dioxygenase-like lactoylglutathione lyase family enzyme